MTSPWADDFPSSWHRLRLKNLIEHVRNGTWGDEPDGPESGVICIRAADFDRVRNRVSRTKLLRRMLTSAELMKHRLQPGDLVLEKSGGGEQQPVGASVLFDLDVQAVATNFAARVRPATGVDPRFLTYLLASTYHLGINQRAIKQTTGLQNLDADAFFNEMWAVPSHGEQRAIADFLDRETARIDALIAKKRVLLRLAEERFERAVFDGIQGGVSSTHAEVQPSGLDWLGDIPVHWGLPPVGAYYDVVLGKMLNPAASSAEDRSPYLRNTNVKWDGFDLSDLGEMHFEAAERQKYELRVGDLLVCEGGDVGRAGVWPFVGRKVFFQKAIHRVRPRDDANPRFLMYCLRAAAKRNVFVVEGNQATIVHLTAEKLRVHRFPYPPPTEQAEIVHLLDKHKDRLEALRQKLNRQLDLLREHRQALVTAAVTGQIDIPVAA